MQGMREGSRDPLTLLHVSYFRMLSSSSRTAIDGMERNAIPAGAERDKVHLLLACYADQRIGICRDKRIHSDPAVVQLCRGVVIGIQQIRRSCRVTAVLIERRSKCGNGKWRNRQ